MNDGDLIDIITMAEFLDKVARPGLLKNPLPDSLSATKFGKYVFITQLLILVTSSYVFILIS